MKIRSVKFINNWVYRSYWSNTAEFIYKKDLLSIRHIIIGAFGFFLFVSFK